MRIHNMHKNRPSAGGAAFENINIELLSFPSQLLKRGKMKCRPLRTVCAFPTQIWCPPLGPALKSW